MAITVKITGAKDSGVVYDDATFLQADSNAYDAISELYEAGATIENIQEAVARSLADSGAEA